MEQLLELIKSNHEIILEKLSIFENNILSIGGRLDEIEERLDNQPKTELVVIIRQKWSLFGSSTLDTNLVSKDTYVKARRILEAKGIDKFYELCSLNSIESKNFHFPVTLFLHFKSNKSVVKWVYHSKYNDILEFDDPTSNDFPIYEC